jgi:hypothetical protein
MLAEEVALVMVAAIAQYPVKVVVDKEFLHLIILATVAMAMLIQEVAEVELLGKVLLVVD